MMTSLPNSWGIHAGATGDGDSLFLSKNVIAVGWVAVGDLGSLPDDFAAFKQKVAQAYPGSKPGAVPVNAGQLHRFAYAIQPNDIVVYPSKHDRRMHIGRITGGYVYDKSDSAYPNQRAVQWLKHLPREDFSPGARFEVGAAMTLFRVKNYAPEFLAALQDVPVSVSANEDGIALLDAVPPLVAANIEEVTQDFIIGQLSQHLKGHPLAAFVAHLFSVMGYRTHVSPPGPDGGVDIILHKDEFRLTPPIIRVQVKSTSGSIGGPDVAYLNGVLKQDEYGIFVTLGDFSKQAEGHAQKMNKLRLINGVELSELILRHYDALDPKYKSIIPLKKIYAPDTSDFQSN